MSEFHVGPVICLYHDAEERDSNGNLVTPARLFVRFHDEEQDMGRVHEIDWLALRELRPDIEREISDRMQAIRAERE
jgi:hypothetical protein